MMNCKLTSRFVLCHTLELHYLISATDMSSDKTAQKTTSHNMSKSNKITTSNSVDVHFSICAMQDMETATQRNCHLMMFKV